MPEISDLNPLALEPERLARLRQRAARLLGGPASENHPQRYQATEALAVLHGLASSAKTAPDALALLHELQVHQVELELQAQELRESRTELEAALRRQTELFDHQPVGCFSVDHRLVLLALNQTGAELLGLGPDRAVGLGPDQAVGLPLDTFFSTDSARRFRAVLLQAAGGPGRWSCPVSLLPRAGLALQAQASVTADPSSKGSYLVNLTPTGDDTRPAEA